MQYGVCKTDNAVILADHETMFSLKDYFEDKPEYTTYDNKNTAADVFQNIAARMDGDLLYGYRYDGDDTVFVIASVSKVDGYTYPDFADNSFKTVYRLARVERGGNPEKTRIAEAM